MKKLLVCLLFFNYPLLGQTLDDKLIASFKEGNIFTKDSMEGIINFYKGDKIINGWIDDNSQLDSNDYKNAISCFSKAFNENNYSSPQMFFEWGICYYKMKKYREAIPYFTLSLSFKSSSCFFQTSLLKIGEDYGIAVESSLQIFPYNNYEYRAHCKSELMDYRGANTDFSKAIKYHPDNYANYISRGICRLYLNKINEAITDFTVFIHSYKKNDYHKGMAYYWRGTGYEYLKLKENACNDYSKAGNYGYSSAFDRIKEFCQ